MFIIKYKKFFLAFSLILVLGSIVTSIVLGLNIGIDFKGGSEMEIRYNNTPRPEQTNLEKIITDIGISPVHIQQLGENSYTIKTRDITTAEHSAIVTVLGVGQNGIEETGFNSIGSSVGHELTRKSFMAITIVIIWIVLYIAFAFRKVSKPVSSWKYGLIAITTLIHDIAIPTGLFAILGRTNNAELDVLFVTAILTVLGLSVSDTIVVFDRIRENLKKHHGDTFSSIVGKSLKETFVRSISTSLTVILALLAVYLFGPVSTKNFALVLITGMFFGTYSSIFVASPLLVYVEEWQGKKKK